MSVKPAPRRTLNIYGFTLLLLVIIGAGFGALSAILHWTGAPDDAVYTAAAAAGALLLWTGVVYAATGLPLWASEDRRDD